MNNIVCQDCQHYESDMDRCYHGLENNIVFNSNDPSDQTCDSFVHKDHKYTCGRRFKW